MRRLVFVVMGLAVLAVAAAVLRMTNEPTAQPATTELTEEQKAAIVDEVSAISAENLSAWRDADISIGMSYYHDSPDFTFALEGQLTHGFAAFGDLVDSVFANVASQTITLSEVQFTVLAPDVVYERAQGTFSPTDTTGVTGPESQYALTALWSRRNGEWKILFGHESFPPPEAESM